MSFAKAVGEKMAGNLGAHFTSCALKCTFAELDVLLLFRLGKEHQLSDLSLLFKRKSQKAKMQRSVPVDARGHRACNESVYFPTCCPTNAQVSLDKLREYIISRSLSKCSFACQATVFSDKAVVVQFDPHTGLDFPYTVL